MFARLATDAQKLAWIAGMLGGDGCIHISARGVRVTYVQAKKGLANIRFVQDVEGGTLFRGKRDARSLNRQEVFTLSLCGADAIGHLARLEPYLVSKRGQLHAAMQFPRTDLRSVPVPDRLAIQEERLRVQRECSRLKHVDEEVEQERMTLELIGGWMAAEGCVKISSRGHASIFICQKRPNILNAIQTFFGIGTVCADRWSVQSRADVEAIASRLLGVSGVKDKVLEIVLKYVVLQRISGAGEGKRRPLDTPVIDGHRRAISELNGGTVKLLPTIQRAPRT
jgi:hypothetical protein